MQIDSANGTISSFSGPSMISTSVPPVRRSSRTVPSRSPSMVETSQPQVPIEEFVFLEHDRCRFGTQTSAPRRASAASIAANSRNSERCGPLKKEASIVNSPSRRRPYSDHVLSPSKTPGKSVSISATTSPRRPRVRTILAIVTIRPQQAGQPIPLEIEGDSLPLFGRLHT